MRPHTKRSSRNDGIREIVNVEHNHREVSESEIEVVWAHEDTRRLLIRRKKYFGNCTTRENRKGKNEAEINVLCLP